MKLPIFISFKLLKLGCYIFSKSGRNEKVKDGLGFWAPYGRALGPTDQGRPLNLKA